MLLLNERILERRNYKDFWTGDVFFRVFFWQGLWDWNFDISCFWSFLCGFRYLSLGVLLQLMGISLQLWISSVIGFVHSMACGTFCCTNCFIWFHFVARRFSFYIATYALCPGASWDSQTLCMWTSSYANLLLLWVWTVHEMGWAWCASTNFKLSKSDFLILAQCKLLFSQYWIAASSF